MSKDWEGQVKDETKSASLFNGTERELLLTGRVTVDVLAYVGAVV